MVCSNSRKFAVLALKNVNSLRKQTFQRIAINWKQVGADISLMVRSKRRKTRKIPLTWCAEGGRSQHRSR